MSASESTFEEDLKAAISGRPVVFGIGVAGRGDDGIGPEVVRRLRAAGCSACVDGGDIPENALGNVVRQQPDTILIVDAVDYGARPGAMRLFGCTAVTIDRLTTHGVSLRLLGDYLQRRTGARAVVVGIQPRSLAPGRMTLAVRKSCAGLVRILAGILPAQDAANHLARNLAPMLKEAPDA